MSLGPEKRWGRSPSWAKALVGCGAVVGLAAIGLFAALARDRSSSLALMVVSILVPGLTLAILLVGISLLVRVSNHVESLSRRIDLQERAGARARDFAVNDTQFDAGASSTPSVRDPSDGGDGQQVVRLLQEIREYALLTEEQRREKQAWLAEHEISTAKARVESLLEVGDIGRAEQVAAELAGKRPDSADAVSLTDQVESARRQREAADMSDVAKEVNDLISMSAWPQARGRAQALQEQYPDNPEARQLMLRIEREYQAAQDEQRRRMYAEVQRFVTRRRWEEALTAAHTFMERFAGSDDAETLRLQLPTLEVNAEVGVRQRLESQIMDWVRHGRYMEAAALAKRVIDQYPSSPQADALRAQLGRLQELANNPDAAPARVRIE